MTSPGSNPRRGSSAGSAEVHSHLHTGPAGNGAGSHDAFDDHLPGEYGEAAAGPTSLRERAERLLEPGGLVATAQRYPLATLAIAAGVGFLLAGRTRSGRRAKVKGRVRQMLVAGAIAALREEAAALLQDRAGSAFRGAALDEEEEDEAPPPRRSRSRRPAPPEY